MTEGVLVRGIIEHRQEKMYRREALRSSGGRRCTGERHHRAQAGEGVQTRGIIEHRWEKVYRREAS